MTGLETTDVSKARYASSLGVPPVVLTEFRDPIQEDALHIVVRALL